MDNFNYYIFSNCDFSYNSAAKTRMLYYAKALAGENHTVYLITCCSTEFKKKDFSQVSPNVYILNQKKTTKNIFQTFGFLRRLDAFSRKQAGKNMFLIYPMTFVFLELLTIVYLKLFKNRSVFYELNEVRKHASAVHDVLSFKKLKYSVKKIVFKTIFTLTEPILVFFDGLICISTEIEKYGKKFNRNTIRIPILTNPDVDVYISDSVYTTKGYFNIGFSGSIIPSKENLVEFINVLNKLTKNKHKIKFNMCGPTKDKYYSQMLEIAEKKDTLNYYGNLDPKEQSNFLRQQDLLVIPRGYNLQNNYGFSTKLSDYLNHKKIILITDISDNGLYIKDGVNGFIVPPNDNESMYIKLVYIINNFENVKKLVVSNAQKTSQDEFSFQNFREPLRDFFNGNNKKKL
ncbi:glycosyltransferase [Zobellia russellii]|uniref:glycosyltransferase n=1 Tax=Zobellia russellii TaxID=248907 RepID=UPI0037DC714D